MGGRCRLEDGEDGEAHSCLETGEPAAAGLEPSPSWRLGRSSRRRGSAPPPTSVSTKAQPTASVSASGLRRAAACC
jgi:hypothetical protein